MSGKVPCIQDFVVRDAMAFLRRCEPRVLEKALPWHGDHQDTLLSGAGSYSTGRVWLYVWPCV